MSGYPVLVAELVERGWTEPEVRRLTCGNALRVLRAAEDAARRLRDGRVGARSA